MERLTQSIRDEYHELDIPATIEARLETLHKLKTPECDGIGLSPVAKLPAKVVILLQVGVRRVIELTEAAIREINQRNLVASALLARGTLETASLLWDVMRQAESVAEGGETSGLTDLDEILLKTLLGGKSKWRLKEEIESRNVVTIIQRLTKQLDVPLENFYALLSEVAHPNYHGMVAIYTEGDPKCGVAIFSDRRADGQRAILVATISTLATSANVVIHSFRIMARSLKALTTLAEKAIHEEGHWPTDEPYPVVRTNNGEVS